MKLSNGHKITIFILVLVLAVFGLWELLSNGHFMLLSPKGLVALRQKQTMLTALGLMALIVVPVYVGLFWILKNRRADRNSKSIESMEASGSNRFMYAVWGAPLLIIACISVIIWNTSHELDPYRPLTSEKQPITIQVVALQWKWLFIYPEQDIATVNFFKMPVGVPVNFELTAEAPMNTFWIPELGGQVYAMAGMENQLHLQANTTGSFNGRTSEINGQGYAGMKFVADAVTEKDFRDWVLTAKASSRYLTENEYTALAKPSENNSQLVYSTVENGLFGKIMMKFMGPDKSE